MHPRAFLSSIVAIHSQRDPDARRLYQNQGRGEFFSQRGTSQEPVRALAEFLHWFTVDDGSWNGFTAPLGAVDPLLAEYGLQHHLTQTLTNLKATYERGDVTVEVLEREIRGSLLRA